MKVIAFLGGTVLGGIVGVTTMCIIQANRYRY